MNTFKISQGRLATLRKVWAGLLMLSMNLSIGGLGTVLLTSQTVYAINQEDAPQVTTTLTVTKVVVPSRDDGRFNLQIDSDIKAHDVGDGGTTHAQNVTAGSHTVTETAGGNTTLSDYTQSFSGDCDASGLVVVSTGDHKTCTITNTRKLPDLTITKTHIGDAVIDGTFQWKLHVANVGNADAVFGKNNEILKDEMPKVGVNDYGVPTKTLSAGVSVTGSIVCAQGGDKKEDLTCKVSGTNGDKVTLAPQSFFDVFIDVHPTATGTFSNPRVEEQHAKKCEVDGTGKVNESDETNNTCSDTLTVIPNTASFRAFKYLDANQNGTYDEGEHPLSDWRISLYSERGLTNIGDKTTGSDGYTDYWTDIPVAGADDYWLQENPVGDGWVAINPTAPAHAANRGSGTYQGLDLTAGGSYTFRFGNYHTCQIDGYKYDADEHPVAGLVVGATIATSTGEDSQLVKGNIIVTKTNQDGYYCLNGISSGTVRVFEWPANGTENDHVTVDGGEHTNGRVNSFFDVFPEIATHMSDPHQPASVDSFFDVFTEIDGVKTQIHSFFDIFTDLTVAPAQQPTDSFFDVFTEVNLDKEQNTHHTVSFYNKPIPVVIDVCPNIEGTQETVPQGKHLNNDGQCVDTPAPIPPVTTTIVENNNGGGGTIGLGFLGGGNGGGIVLGAATGTGETCTSEYLTDYLRMGTKNDPAQVILLQNFLNKHLGTHIPVTGFFGPLTREAVKQFQLENADQILAPWAPFGLSNQTPTGYVYKTTKRWINLLECKNLDIPLPELP